MLECKLCSQFVFFFFSVHIRLFGFFLPLATIGGYNFRFTLSYPLLSHILLLLRWTSMAIDDRYLWILVNSISVAHAVHCSQCSLIVIAFTFRISHQRNIIGFLVCFSRVIIVCNQFFVSLIRFTRSTPSLQIERMDKFRCCWKYSIY